MAPFQFKQYWPGCVHDGGVVAYHHQSEVNATSHLQKAVLAKMVQSSEKYFLV